MPRPIHSILLALGASIAPVAAEAAVPLPDEPRAEYRPVGEAAGDLLPVGIEVDAAGLARVDHRLETRVWDVESGALRRALPPGVFYESVRGIVLDFRVAGEVAASDAETGKVIARYDFGYNAAQPERVWFSGGGALCHAQDPIGGALVTFEPASGEIAWISDGPANFWKTGVDGRILAADPSFSIGFDGPSWTDFRLLDAATGEPVAAIEQGYWRWQNPNRLSEPILLVAAAGGRIAVMDPRSGETATLALPEGEFVRGQPSVSADGSKVAYASVDSSADADLELKVWDVGTGAVAEAPLSWELEYPAPASSRLALALDAGGSALYVGDQTGAVRRLDLAGGGARAWDSITDNRIEALAVLPGENRLLVETARGEIHLLDTEESESLYSGAFLRSDFRLVPIGMPDKSRWAFHSELGRLLIIAADGSVAAIDVATGAALDHLPERTRALAGVWSAGAEGLYWGRFLDGDVQLFSAAVGAFQGPRARALPRGARPLDHDAAANRALATSDGIKVFDVADGSMIADLTEAAREFDWRIRPDPDPQRYQAEWGQVVGGKLLRSGELALIHDQTRAALIDISTAKVVWEREFAAFYSAAANRKALALDLQEWDEAALQRKLVAVDLDDFEETFSMDFPGSVPIAISSDARHFAVIDEGKIEASPDLSYRMEFALREYAIADSGFELSQETIFERSMGDGSGPGAASPELLRYEGPSSPVAARVFQGMLTELRSGMTASTDAVDAGRVERLDWDGSLLAWDADGLLRRSQLHAWRAIGLDIEIEDGAARLSSWESALPESEVEYQSSDDLSAWAPLSEPFAPLSDGRSFFRAFALEPARFDPPAE